METVTRAVIEKLATLKIIKGATKDLDPGTYRVKGTVEYDGTLTKGEDYVQTFWNDLPLLGMLLRAMNAGGVILGKRQIKAMVADVLANDLTSKELLAEKELKKWVKALKTEMQDACTKIATGKTTCSLSISEPVIEPRAVAADTETVAAK